MDKTSEELLKKSSSEFIRQMSQLTKEAAKDSYFSDEIKAARLKRIAKKEIDKFEKIIADCFS